MKFYKMCHMIKWYLEYFLNSIVGVHGKFFKNTNSELPHIEINQSIIH